jgi:hypothetical protein
MEVDHLMADRKQRIRKGWGTTYSLQRYTSSDLCPPTRPYSFKFPPPPKLVPAAGVQEFNMRACGGHFIFKL